jgi:hypothetical protein
MLPHAPRPSQVTFTVTDTPVVFLATDYGFVSEVMAIFDATGKTLLASGNCIDGAYCGAKKSLSTCKAGTSTTSFTQTQAVANSVSSTAYIVYQQPGTYTVLVRQNNYMGCGTGGLTGADCYPTAGIAFKADPSEACLHEDHSF